MEHAGRAGTRRSLPQRGHPRVNPGSYLVKKALRHLVGGDATARFTVMEKLEDQYGSPTHWPRPSKSAKAALTRICGKQKGQRRRKGRRAASLDPQQLSSKAETPMASPRIRLDLRELGKRCGKNRVARLMREQGLRARQKRRFRPRTTESRHNHKIAENWLAKVPAPDRPGQPLAKRYHLHRDRGGMALSGLHPRWLFAPRSSLTIAGKTCSCELTTTTFDHAATRQRPASGTDPPQ